VLNVAEPRRLQLKWVAAALAGGLVLFAGGGTLFYRHVVVMKPTELDRRTLAVAADFVSQAQGRETWSKRRTIDWGTKVSYECRGLGRSGRASVTSWRLDSGDAAKARIAFQTGIAGMKAGFAAAKGADERIEEGPALDKVADLAKAWTFYVGDKKAGVVVMVRRGRHIWFLTVNGYVIDDWKLEQVVDRHARAMDELDT
jgi:hypothetical protein